MYEDIEIRITVTLILSYDLVVKRMLDTVIVVIGIS